MRLRPLAVMALTMGLLALPALLWPGRAAADVGFEGPHYSGTVAPTAEKPQSKLWVVGSTWFGSFYNKLTGNFEIYRLNSSNGFWNSTGAVIDERETSKADALWDGNRLYIASAGPTSSGADSARVLRYSYDSSAKTFSLDSGFPVNVSNGGMEAVVIDKDTTGKLWVTFTQGNKVYVNRSTIDDRIWRTPYVIPTAGASNLDPDDLSSVVAYNGRIGVMWSNQNSNEWAMHFASHRDGDADTAWTLNTAIQQDEWSDDHLSLKSLQADPSGQVYALTKTSLNSPNQPLNVLSVLGTDNVWRRYTVGTVADNETRAIVVLDYQNRKIHAFAAAPCCSGGVVYHKAANMSSPSFPSGLGTPFLQSTTSVNINNVSSTKQPLDGTTDLVVVASDDHTKAYWHNMMDLGPGGIDTPDTSILSGPTGSVASTSASFTFSSTESGSTFQCRLDGGSFENCSSPKNYNDLAEGPHTFSVRAVKGGGNVDFTPAVRTWSVDFTAPDTAVSSGPPPVSGSTAPTFEFAANEPDAKFECSLDGAAYEPCASPKTYQGLTEGAHALGVRAVDAAGNVDATPTEYTWAIDTTAPETSISSSPAAVDDSADPEFEIDASEAGSTFECKLGDAAYTACGSPVGYKDLFDGDYTFTVRATDPAGNTDPTPATFSWTIRGSGMRILTFSPEADATVEGSSPNKNFGTEALLEIDNSPQQAAYLRFDLKGLSGVVQSAKLRLRSVNGTQDGPAIFSAASDWTETGITWNSRPARLAGPADDKGAIPSNTAPEYDVTSLIGSNGLTTFELAATSGDGFEARSREAEEGRPELVIVDADKVAPETTIESAPSGTIRDKSASFSFSANEAGSTFECKLDGGDFESCSSPLTYSNLADGSHTFSVRATDIAGKVDKTPATATWAIDTRPLPTPPTGGGKTPGGGAGPGATTGPGARGADKTRPVVEGLTLSPTAFVSKRFVRRAAARPTGTTVSYRLSEDATVAFRVKRIASGRKVGRHCVRPTRRNRARGRCTRFQRLKGGFRDRGRLGVNAFEFAGRLNKKSLRPRRYRLVAVPIDAAGNRGRAASVDFRILARRGR